MKFLAAVALPAYALDQLTKWWIYTHFQLNPSPEIAAKYPAAVEATLHLPLEYVVIPDWFRIIHVGNTGAAFSFLTGHGWVFVLLSVLAFAGLIVAWKKNMFPDALSRWGVALIFGGILGNVTDRFVHGYVVDFLSFDLHFRYADPFPTFNVADSCIFCAACCFLLAAIQDARKPKAEQSTVKK